MHHNNRLIEASRHHVEDDACSFSCAEKLIVRLETPCLRSLARPEGRPQLTGFTVANSFSKRLQQEIKPLLLSSLGTHYSSGPCCGYDE